eukprot:137515-Prorocentrum_minimum.AAC.1
MRGTGGGQEAPVLRHNLALALYTPAKGRGQEGVRRGSGGARPPSQSRACASHACQGEGSGGDLSIKSRRP